MGDLGVFGAWLMPALVVGLVYGALLGFTAVVGWQQFLSAILLSLLLCVIYTLDHPLGPIGVTPQPFSHAVQVFDLVDRGS